MTRKKKDADWYEKNKYFSVDYNKWKREIKKNLLKKYNKEIVKKFIEFISSRYDRFGRNFLNHVTALMCWDFHNKVVKYNQHQVYGFFGRGGVGKSTLAKNVLYFHDPTFNQSRIATNLIQFGKIISDLMERKDEGKYKALLLDEVEVAQHVASKEWRIMEDLLQQIRKRNFIIGICSTRLNNVKSGMYDLITGIFAFTDLFRYDYYDEETTPGICAKIKKLWRYKGNFCFSEKELYKYRRLFNVPSHKYTPLDHEIEKYETEKDRVFTEKVREFARIIEEKNSPKNKLKEGLNDIDRLLLRWREQGYKNIEIAELLGCSDSNVAVRFRKIKEKAKKYGLKLETKLIGQLRRLNMIPVKDENAGATVDKVEIKA